MENSGGPSGGQGQGFGGLNSSNENPPRPNIGAGGSNIFGGLIAGKGGQSAGLAPPAAQSEYQQHQQQHPQQQQQQQQQPVSYANGLQNGLDKKPVSNRATPTPGHNSTFPPPNQNSMSGPNHGQGPPPNAPSAAPPASSNNSTRPASSAPNDIPRQNFNDLDIHSVPREMKKEGSDWFAIFNPNVPRTLDVNLVHTLDHDSVVCCAKFSADGKYLATGCNRAAIIFDVKTGQKVTVLQDDTANSEGDLYIRSVVFSPDGTKLATGAEDKQIRIWDIASKSIRHVFTGHEQDIYSLDFSKNGRFVASGSGDRTARVWDLETSQQVLTLSIEDGVTTVAISPDGNYVAAGSLDKVVRLWDAKTGYLVERLEGHKDSVYSVAFSPNGKDLYSGSLDNTIKMWELSSPRGVPMGNSPKGGYNKTTFVGHKDFVLSVSPSPDGQWLVSGSKDRCVHFWDPRTAQMQLSLQGHKNSVISVSVSPSGNLFATGSGDCRARIWSYETIQ